MNPASALDFLNFITEYLRWIASLKIKLNKPLAISKIRLNARYKMNIQPAKYIRKKYYNINTLSRGILWLNIV